MKVRFFLENPFGRELAKILARRSIGLASGGDVVRWAVDALDDLDSRSIRMLAGLSYEPDAFEVDGHLRDLAEEMGTVLPNRDQLSRLYARITAEEITQGVLSPEEGAKRLYDLYRLTNSFDELSTWCVLDDYLEVAKEGLVGTVPEAEARIMREARAIINST